MKTQLPVLLLILVSALGCAQLRSDTPSSKDMAVYHELLNVALREYLIRRNGKPLFEGPVLAVIPNRFRPGYSPSIPGVEIVVGGKDEAHSYANVVLVDKFQYFGDWYEITIVRNPYTPLGSSFMTYTIENVAGKWQCCPPNRDIPLAGKS